MSETIDERYEHITRRLNEIDSDKQGFLFSLAIKALLDDLMAERGKKVNLDEIFPKEVMEKAAYFECRDVDDVFESVSEPSECVKGAVGNYLAVMGYWQDSLEQPWRYAFTLDEKVEFVVIAYSDKEIAAEDGDDYLEELARVRVRLGLTVEILEDK